MSGVTGTVAELLAAHLPVYEADGDYGERQWIECSCGSDYFVDTKADEATHRQHVAEVIAASGLLVPTAEVREGEAAALLSEVMEALGQVFDLDADPWFDSPFYDRKHLIRLHARLREITGRSVLR